MIYICRPSKFFLHLGIDILYDRLSDEYGEGVKSFLSFAFSRLGEGTTVIKYPRVKCCNSSEHARHIVEMDLTVYDTLEGYFLVPPC